MREKEMRFRTAPNETAVPVDKLDLLRKELGSGKQNVGQRER